MLGEPQSLLKYRRVNLSHTPRLEVLGPPYIQQGFQVCLLSLKI